jgi:hypothetical protein
MTAQDDVRRIALALPATSEDARGFRFLVGSKAFVWSWMERVDPKRPRRENAEVVAVRVADELEKQDLLTMDPDIFFTEPHYDGYPAVLVRLTAVDASRLEIILADAWRSRAPRQLLKDLGAARA